MAREFQNIFGNQSVTIWKYLVKKRKVATISLPVVNRLKIKKTLPEGSESLMCKIDYISIFSAFL